MGASESLADKYKVIKDFNKLIDHNIFKPLKEEIQELKSKVETFFNVYDQLNDEAVKNQININLYFQSIILSIEAFKGFLVYADAIEAKDKVDMDSIFNFHNDFKGFIIQLTQIVTILTETLEKLIEDTTPALISDFHLKLIIFCSSINIQRCVIPQYYTMTIYPVIQLYEHIQNSSKKYINITMPYGYGKTNFVPLLLASKSLTNNGHNRFIILVEQKASSIHYIKDKYNEILNQNKIDDDTENEVNVTSSLPEFIDYVNSDSFFPVIGILTPIDALQLVCSVPNPQEFISKLTFVFDDIELRSDETEILASTLHKEFIKLKSTKDDELPQMVIMSTIRDDKFLSFIDHFENISIKPPKSTFSKKVINYDSIDDVLQKDLFIEMQKYFKACNSNDSFLDFGSVIVFVPSEKAGDRLYNQIFEFYSKENSINICPLSTKIKRFEKLDDFYVNLLNDMKNEFLCNDKTLFLLPLNLAENATKEKLEVANSKLPSPFVNRLCRVIITTIKNENLLHIQDPTIIFDTGIDELEIFDSNQSSIHKTNDLVPIPLMERHQQIFGERKNCRYIEFDIKNKERPNSIKPLKSDTCKTFLALRNFGVNLENQIAVNSCVELLRKIGIIDASTDKLTEIGKNAARFFAVSPFFALATSKFTDNQQFGFLCSLVIENANSLVTNPTSKFLCKHFNKDSDVVTLLDALYEVSTSGINDSEETGLSVGTVYLIYSQIESAFNVKDGKSTVVELVKWSREQSEGTFGVVDKFIKLIHPEFINKRKFSFLHILNASLNNKQPTLVYKSDENQDVPSLINFSSRPGQIGLQSPGSILALSVVKEEEEENRNYATIVHKDTSLNDDHNRGVVSLQVENPALSNLFFMSLFKGYMNGSKESDNFIPIYSTETPNMKLSNLIHVTENEGQTCISYCPKNEIATQIIKESIPLLSSLMPFVPRSIITKVHSSLCAVEVIGYGTCFEYNTKVHRIKEEAYDDDDDDDYNEFSNVYPINKKTLEFAAQCVNNLRSTSPSVRFAITGEFFYYDRRDDGQEIEFEPILPDVDPKIKSVFDDNHPSHLVLIVDNNFPCNLQTQQLPWLSEKEEEEKKDAESEFEKMLINTASRTMDAFGYAERSADLFYVTLGGGYLTVKKGQIPKAIHEKIGFSESEKDDDDDDDESVIQCDIHSLIRNIIPCYDDGGIQLKSIGSTNTWKDYPSKEELQEELFDKINHNISTHFHLKEESVACSFIGTSLLVIRVEGLDKNKDTSCDEIAKILHEIKLVDFQVTKVVHESTVGIHVQNMRRFNLKGELFEQKVKTIANKFGFLNSLITDYVPKSNDDQARKGILGEVFVELIGLETGNIFVTEILEEFKNIHEDVEEDLFSSSLLIKYIEAQKQINNLLGPSPEIGVLQSGFILMPEEIEQLKNLIEEHNKSLPRRRRFKVDENFNVLIFPASEEAAAKEIMDQIRMNDDTTCQYMCEPPVNFLPQPVFEYQKNGTVKKLLICQQCTLSNFENMDDFMYVTNHFTHKFNPKNILELSGRLPGLIFIIDDIDDNERWPQIPLGQGVYALMSGPNRIGGFVKMWFTTIVEFTVYSSKRFITFCPKHPYIVYEVPHKNKRLACPYCSSVFCRNCWNWHSLDTKCQVDDVKRCPNCYRPIIMIAGSNHIHCSCGKHWCYKYGLKSPIFDTADEYYAFFRNL